MKKNKLMLMVNLFVIAVICVLNYFYQRNSFDYTLKCICSACFAVLGLINLAYAIKPKASGPNFYILLALGLVFSMLGDVFIAFHFVVGAGIFAVGHIFFLLAYCTLQKIKGLDLMISGGLFLCALLFLLFFPSLSFEVPVFRIVCIVYALIISTMFGKAFGNFVRVRNTCNGILALGSLLFVFSDLMLVLTWFVGLWPWTDHACMATYYPALCLLTFAMLMKTTESNRLSV